MKRRRSQDPMPVGVAIFFVVVGLIIGTVFIFGNRYWAKPIQKTDAIQTSARYEGYEIHRKWNTPNIKEIKIILTDKSAVYIDGACVSDEVKKAIVDLPEGATVNMLVHPNSDTVWELKHGGRIILPFEEAQKDIKNENIGFTCLGVFMYFCAAYGGGSLLMRYIRARKRKNVR